MSTEQPIPDDAEAWRPLPNPEEREGLVLEFQRLAARLVQAQLISSTRRLLLRPEAEALELLA
jgi:hypothetical protein